MKEQETLNHPSLVAVWPGMGHVAINAGYYLMSKLGMRLDGELSTRELFEINHVEVHEGLIHTPGLPRSRFFIWRDPAGKHDLVVFVGEAQPPSGTHAYCSHIIDHARAFGVERVFTFAAMATQMNMEDESRVFAAATDASSLAPCKDLKLHLLQDGQISGLNGVLLGVAAERGLPGTCLLGEMPHIFAQVPYPKASLAVLEAFRTLVELDLNLDELEIQADSMQENLKHLLDRIEAAIHAQENPDEPSFGPPLEPEKKEGTEGLKPEDRQRLKELFAAANKDQAQAYRLKQELDRLKVFNEYEDRFLDLFKTPKEDGDEHGREESAA